MKKILNLASYSVLMVVLTSFILHATFQLEGMHKARLTHKRAQESDDESESLSQKRVHREITQPSAELKNDEDLFDADYNEAEETLDGVRTALLESIETESLKAAFRTEFQKRAHMDGVVTQQQLINAHDKTTGETLLMWAAENGETLLCRALMDLGAFVEVKSRAGKTALGVAANKGCTSPCRALRSRGANADTHTRHTTPLLSAAKNNHEGVCRILAPVAGSTMNRANPQGYAPLFYAVKNNNSALSALFIQHGALLNAVTTQKGMTPLMIAAENKLFEIARILVEAGASIHAVDHLGNTALMYAVSRGALDVANLLLANGAQPLHVNKDQETALHKTAQLQNTLMISLLLYYTIPWRNDTMTAFLCSLKKTVQENGLAETQATVPKLLYNNARVFIQPELAHQKADFLWLLQKRDHTGKTAYDYLKFPALNPVHLDRTVSQIRKQTQGPIQGAQVVSRVNQTQTRLQLTSGGLTCSLPQ